MSNKLQIHGEGLRTRHVLGRVCTCKSKLRGVYFGHSFIMILIHYPPLSVTCNSKVHCVIQSMLPLLPLRR